MEMAITIAILVLPPLVLGVWLVHRRDFAHCADPDLISEDLRQAVDRIEAFSLLPMFTVCPALVIGLFMAARNLHTQHSETVAAGAPSLSTNPGMLLLPALFSGLAGYAALGALATTLVFKDRVALFEHACLEPRRFARVPWLRLIAHRIPRDRYGLFWRRGFLVMLVAVPTVPAVVMPLFTFGCYAVADEHVFSYSPVLSLEQVQQPYEDFEQVAWQRHRRGLFGNWSNTPHGVVRFADGTEWSSQNLSRNSDDVLAFLHAVAKRAYLPLRVVDGRPGR